MKFSDAAKFYKEHPHQKDAWEYLQRVVHKEILDEFSKIYRNEKNISQSNIPKAALEIIKKFEGFSSKAYYDPHTGNLPITIGYGSTRKSDGTPFYIGEVITQQKAEELLAYQISKEFIPSLQKIPHWNQMNENQKSALISFAYNLGANFYGSSGFSTISKVLKNKEWDKVPDAFTLYVNPGSIVEAGLMRRRIAEANLWSN